MREHARRLVPQKRGNSVILRDIPHYAPSSTMLNVCSAVALRNLYLFAPMSRRVVAITDKAWRTGSFVPETALYKVFHSAHSLPGEVTLLRGQHFPRCEACEEPVHFKLRRVLPLAQSSSFFRIELYQLPVQTHVRRAS